jgi:PBP1b-binding outer membrane lipoprotein LpoB
MRSLFSIILVSVILWGCSTQNNVKPTDSSQTGGNQTKPPADTTKKLIRDDSIHMVAFIIYAQKVKTSVSGKILILAFDENVNFFVLADGYKKNIGCSFKGGF